MTWAGCGPARIMRGVSLISSRWMGRGCQRCDVLADSAPLDLLVEIKTFPDRPEATLAPARLVEAVVRVLRETGTVRNAVLFAFDWRVLEAAAMLEPALRRCCLTAPETVKKRADLWFGKTRLDLCAPGTPGSVARAVASTGAVVWAPFHKCWMRLRWTRRGALA